MTLLLTYSPQHALIRDVKEAAVFKIDVARFARVICGETEPAPVSLNINPTASDLYELCEGASFISCDIETAPETREEPWTGKDPTRARLKSIAFGTETHACAIWWENVEVGSPLYEAVKWILKNPLIKKVWQNGQWFDHRVLRRYELHTYNNEDTRDFRRALSSTSRLSLGYLCSIYCDFEPWKEGEGEEDDTKGIIFTDDEGKLLRYNALDTIVTSRVWARMQEEFLREPQLERVRLTKLYGRNKWKSEQAARMHDVGFGVDANNHAFMDWALEVQAEEEVKVTEALVDVPTFRCTPNDLRKLIFKRHETSEIARFHLADPVHPSMWTEKGAISVGNDSLTQLLMDPLTPDELKKIIKSYWQAESTKKARSTFISSDLVRQAIGKDSRLRAGWNSLGTDTGRWSCNSPNIMNLEQYLRAMYGTKKGRVLVHADFNQLEVWVRLAVTKDRALESALSSGDLYTADAVSFFNLPASTTKKTLKKSARDLCKMLHLATQYGAGVNAIFQQILGRGFLEVKYAQVAAYHAYFRIKYRDTVDFWTEEYRRVLACGYSETRIYHQRRLYAKEPSPTETSNYPIQGTAAEVADDSMRRIVEALPPTAHLVVQLHDAFDVECDEKDVEEVKHVMRESMELPTYIEGVERVFKVEIKTSNNWADL